MVDTLNGEPIRDFQQFANALRQNQQDYVVLENDNGYQMVIEHAEAMESREQILQRYRIPSVSSPGLFEE